jgi:hypothetical protein
MESKGTILCMFSGGLDSLGVLYLLLTDQRYADHRIHVHHMVLKNIENRALAEKQACSNIVSYFRDRDYREFDYSESLFDYSFMDRFFMFDSTVYGFMGANMMINDPTIVMLASGRSKDDIVADESDYSRINQGLDVYHAVLPQAVKYQRPYILPVAHLTRQQIYEMLPVDLRLLAWSCRTPRYEGDVIHECGQCVSCKSMRKVRKTAPG